MYVVNESLEKAQKTYIGQRRHIQNILRTHNMDDKHQAMAAPRDDNDMIRR